MNETCLAFFNLDTIETAPRVLLRMVHPNDRKYILSKLQDSIKGETVTDIEFRVTHGNNQRWLRMTPYLVQENGETVLIGKAEDFTVSKANIEVINNHTQKKNSILNILAHDLAGPIGTIKNLSALLERETVHLQNPKIDRYLAMIADISKSGIKLVQEFLDQEFLESVSVQLLKKRVELVYKTQASTEKYFAMQEILQVKFVCEANKEHIFVEIDEDKFMQVINNLISNALKFTPDGGTIKLHIQENKKDVLITVADNGIGIPQQHQATLFEKFSNARRTGIRGEHSTGLGMHIIKTIVDWHQGKLWFESEENKGTTFFIQLPKA